MLHEQGRVRVGVSVNLMVLQWVAVEVSSPLVGLSALGGQLEVIPLEVMQHATDSLDQLIV